MQTNAQATQPTRTKNLGTAERVLRILLGGALAIWALGRLLGGGAMIGQVLDVAFIALGADFVVTGVRGYCPLYRRLGWSTARHIRTP